MSHPGAWCPPGRPGSGISMRHRLSQPEPMMGRIEGAESHRGRMIHPGDCDRGAYDVRSGGHEQTGYCARRR